MMSVTKPEKINVDVNSVKLQNPTENNAEMRTSLSPHAHLIRHNAQKEQNDPGSGRQKKAEAFKH